jgi:hypothetical protein
MVQGVNGVRDMAFSWYSSRAVQSLLSPIMAWVDQAGVKTKVPGHRYWLKSVLGSASYCTALT